MAYFVIQVQTGIEDKYLKATGLGIQDDRVRMHWPRRLIREKKAGLWKNTRKPIFPGYLFIESEEVYPSYFYKLKKIKGFIRYLANNQTIRPLCGPDRDILVHFLSFGEVVGKSLVVFDENNRIIVKSGPLKTLEGYIVKVDRRKKRAKIKLDLYESSFLIDLSFECLENLPESAPLKKPIRS